MDMGGGKKIHVKSARACVVRHLEVKVRVGPMGLNAGFLRVCVRFFSNGGVLFVEEW